MRRKLVVGNWKLNGSLAANAALVAAFRQRFLPATGAVCGVCVPAVYLAQAAELLANTGIEPGAQDLSREVRGAFTGEVSAAMLADVGAKLCIVGHSERRALFGDTDEQVAVKFGRAKAAGLTPILCVGETLAEREAGVTDAVVIRQLDAVLAPHGRAALENAVVAYEPVWAIGTGKTATSEQAQSVHAVIRARLAKVDAGLAAEMPILYGGSVKAANAAELFAMPDVDGGLVGGASLDAQEFVGIWNAMRARLN
ncbi:MAG: triose-phosphate isomerase [Betaproteobacteria bacterium]|nr:triose-phosphate isomerase [Betaproteobacteria bacterium]